MRRSHRNLLAALVIAGVVALGDRASAQSLLSLSEFGSPGRAAFAARFDTDGNELGIRAFGNSPGGAGFVDVAVELS
jgi:hypothetical protein